MAETNTLLGIIPARKGSKGIKGKNFALLNGKPLIAYTIEAAVNSGAFTKIVVTTDSEDIKKIAESYGIEVIERPDDLCTDNASSLEVIAHTLEYLDNSYDAFMLLQPTSPLRSKEDINNSVSLFNSAEHKSLVSVTDVKHSPYKMLVMEDDVPKPLFSKEQMTMPRQKLPKALHVNGAIYISVAKDFLTTKDLFMQPLALYTMDEKSSVDIDTPLDLIIAEAILKN